ncbi:MAG TPA: hypothetical protein VJS66_07430 [Burkholderiales bacterium]|nr:hypothetical protein [Burkholderiales bacterium]
MPPVKRLLSVLLLATLPSIAVGAGKYTWFGDTANNNDPNALQFRPSVFGTEIYRSMRGVENDAEPTNEHTVSLYGDYASRGLVVDEAGDASARRFANFGVRWQHRVSSQDRLSVSAQQAESTFARSMVTGPESLDTRATISWTRDFAWAWRPSITGGVFLGDESARDDSTRVIGRRYYGFTVGGEMRLLQAHTPYVSFRMERSLYDAPETSSFGTNTGSMASSWRAIDDSSRLAAGWRWQAARGLSFQAEASYGFNLDNNPDPLLRERERSRLFFGTRFDFK